jgi:hypothetical protein
VEWSRILPTRGGAHINKQPNSPMPEDEKFWRWVMSVSGAIIIGALVTVFFVGGTGTKVLSSVGVIAPTGDSPPIITNGSAPSAPSTTKPPTPAPAKAGATLASPFLLPFPAPATPGHAATAPVSLPSFLPSPFPVFAPLPPPTKPPTGGGPPPTTTTTRPPPPPPPTTTTTGVPPTTTTTTVPVTTTTKICPLPPLIC